MDRDLLAHDRAHQPAETGRHFAQLGVADLLSTRAKSRIDFRQMPHRLLEVGGIENHLSFCRHDGPGIARPREAAVTSDDEPGHAFCPQPDRRTGISAPPIRPGRLASRARGRGTFRVRIEDIDIRRCKRAHETSILADLKWLGLDWDGEVRRQSGALRHLRQGAGPA